MCRWQREGAWGPQPIVRPFVRKQQPADAAPGEKRRPTQLCAVGSGREERGLGQAHGPSETARLKIKSAPRGKPTLSEGVPQGLEEPGEIVPFLED